MPSTHPVRRLAWQCLPVSIPLARLPVVYHKVTAASEPSECVYVIATAEGAGLSRSGGTRVRSKIAAMLVSLAALWAFGAYITGQAGLKLLWVNTLDRGVGRPTDALVTALQVERRISVVALGGPDRGPGASVRANTDLARAALVSSATS